MKKKLFSLAIALTMVTGCVTGCGGGSKEETKTDATETTETKETSDAAEETEETADTEASGDKIIRMACEDPKKPLDMHLNADNIIMKLTDNIAESLLLTNEEGELEPTLLAEMPELSEDKLTYSFTLKDGVTFHNGETLTTDDVKYSLERMVSKYKMSSLLDKVVGYQEFFDEQTDEIAGIEIVDESHFKINMAEIYTPLLSALSTPYCAIYPKEACEEAGDEWGTSVLYGTGPFKLVSYDTGVGAELAKNENYHDGEVKLDGIKYLFIDDPNTGVLEYQKGNVDVVYLDSSLYPTYANGDLKDELYTFNPVGGYFMTFNVNDITDPKVREALSYAVDREALCQGVLFGTATPNSRFLQDWLIGADDSVEQITYDPEKVKELLTEAGYPDGYDLKITVNTSYPISLTIATAVQAQMEEAGVHVEIEQVDAAAWSDMKKSGSITCNIGNWYVDYNDPDSMLYPVSDGRTNLTSSFWHNDEFKQLMIDGIQTDDADERQEIYSRCDYILTHEDFAVAMLYNETMFYLKKPYVKDFDVTFTYRTMYKDADIVK